MTTTQTGSRPPEARYPELFDLLNIDALLSNEELAAREEIRGFVRERIPKTEKEQTASSKARRA